MDYCLQGGDGSEHLPCHGFLPQQAGGVGRGTPRPCSSWVRVFHGSALVISCSVSSVSALKSTVAFRVLGQDCFGGGRNPRPEI